MDISVVVPCHNGQPYLSQAIRSVLDQTRTPNEVIVIEDSSTDDPAAVARTFGHAVRVESKRFRNAAKARNSGASLARGDAVMFQDAGDVMMRALARETPLRLTSGDEALCRRTFGEPEWKRVATSILRQVGRGLPGSRRSAGPGEPILSAEGGEPVEVRYGLEDPS